MTPLKIWAVIVGMTFVTILTRAGMLVLPSRFALPDSIRPALRFAPACALVAIIAPDLALHAGALDLSIDNPRLVAALCATALFLWTRNMVATIIAGMLVLTILRFFPL